VEAMAGLKEHVRELRFQLARAVKMRHVPELHFHYDDSVDRGEKIDSLLRSVGSDLMPSADDDGDDSADEAGKD
jgi:ribosome-binding factor A